MGKTGVKWVREKIQGRLIDDRRWGGRKVSQSSRAVLLQHHQDTDPQREQTALQRPHAHILARSLVTASSSLSLFFSFFSLACSGGGGGYIDPFLSW